MGPKDRDDAKSAGRTFGVTLICQYSVLHDVLAQSITESMKMNGQPVGSTRGPLGHHPPVLTVLQCPKLRVMRCGHQARLTKM